MWKAELATTLGSAESWLDGYFRKWPIALLPGHRARRAVGRLKDISRFSQPRQWFAVLRTMCDGWTTGRRFGERTSRCMAGCDAEDSIAHYAGCPRIRAVALRQLGLPPLPNPRLQLEAFLLLTTGWSQEELKARALWTSSVYRWHCSMRHLCPRPVNDAAVQVLDHVVRDFRAGTRTTR